MVTRGATMLHLPQQLWFAGFGFVVSATKKKRQALGCVNVVLFFGKVYPLLKNGHLFLSIFENLKYFSEKKACKMHLRA
jgi:hypothetical protein